MKQIRKIQKGGGERGSLGLDDIRTAPQSQYMYC